MKKGQIEEVEFLNYIYKNAEMGIVGIDDVITKVSNKDLEDFLKEQRDDYEMITKEAESILKKYGKQNEEIGVMAKVSSKIMADMSMLKENTDNNVAKMMMEGTNKGIIALTEKINAYNKSDAEIVLLAEKFQEILEKNITELKKYL